MEIHAPGRMGQVEWETLKWIDWYNNRRLLGTIGYTIPAKAEQAFYANLSTRDKAAQLLIKTPSNKSRAVRPCVKSAMPITVASGDWSSPQALLISTCRP
jgi:hypothetical protein